MKQTATGGKDSPSDSVNVCAISRTSNFAEPEFISSPSVFATSFGFIAMQLSQWIPSGA